MLTDSKQQEIGGVNGFSSQRQWKFESCSLELLDSEIIFPYGRYYLVTDVR